MFDISLTQFAVLTALGYFVFGAKELSLGARVVGRVVGRSVAKVQVARQQMVDLLSSQKTSAVHPELRQGIESFMNVQNEIRSATMNPMITMQHAVLSQKPQQPQSQQTQSDAPRVIREFIPKESRTKLYEQNAQSLSGTVRLPSHASSEQSDGKGRQRPVTEDMGGGADIILRSITYHNQTKGWKS